MKKMRCLIVDDEALARRLLGVYLEGNTDIKVGGECRSAIEARLALLNGEIDLLFLDIQMPGMTGVELVEGLENPPMVIFTTAYENYAVKAFELDVVDYLVKPFSKERFEKACQKALELHSQKNGAQEGDNGFIFLKTAYEWKKFILDEVLYVEGMREYVRVQGRDGETSLVYIRMKEMEKKLGEGFLRVHKSFIVNLEKVEGIGSNEIRLGGRKIPVGKVYKKELQAYFS